MHIKIDTVNVNISLPTPPETLSSDDEDTHTDSCGHERWSDDAFVEAMLKQLKADLEAME